MSGKVKKGIFILLTAILTVGLLFGAYFGYNMFFVNQPLSTTLDNSEFIGEYKIIQDKSAPILKIKVTKVADLEAEYQRFLSESGNLLRNESLTLEISSSPNENLKEFYQEIHPAVYEAMVLGNFTNLQSKIKKEALNFKLSKASLFINEQNIYLQLEDQEKYLYCIFNRGQDSFPKIINNMGSDIK